MIPYKDITINTTDRTRLTMHDNESYADYHCRLSSNKTSLCVQQNDQTVFDVVVPPTVFNPLGGIAAQAFVSGLLNNVINVEGQRVVDLGCGCGIIGIAAIKAGCSDVLFTDINPNITAIEEHQLFRRGKDRVVVQDLCNKEGNAAYDWVLFSIPSTIVATAPKRDTYEVGIFREVSLPEKATREAARVLAPEGKFCFFYRLRDENFLDWIEFTQLLSDLFNLATLKVLWYRQESNAHALLLCIEKRKA